MIFRPLTAIAARDLLGVLDAACFPHDVPPEWGSADWFVGRDEHDRIAAYCAWREEDGAGFHYRSGVSPHMRGMGLQRAMIKAREVLMTTRGLRLAITYTDADNAASMRNLIGEGYLPYDPSNGRRLSGRTRLGRCGFVHWEKKL